MAYFDHVSKCYLKCTLKETMFYLFISYYLELLLVVFFLNDTGGLNLAETEKMLTCKHSVKSLKYTMGENGEGPSQTVPILLQ